MLFHSRALLKSTFYDFFLSYWYSYFWEPFSVLHWLFIYFFFGTIWSISVGVLWKLALDSLLTISISYQVSLTYKSYKVTYNKISLIFSQVNFLPKPLYSTNLTVSFHFFIHSLIYVQNLTHDPWLLFKLVLPPLFPNSVTGTSIHPNCPVRKLQNVLLLHVSHAIC